MHTHTHTHTHTHAGGYRDSSVSLFFFVWGAVQAPRCPLRAPLAGATQARACALPC